MGEKCEGCRALADLYFGIKKAFKNIPVCADCERPIGYCEDGCPQKTDHVSIAVSYRAQTAEAEAYKWKAMCERLAGDIKAFKEIGQYAGEPYASFIGRLDGAYDKALAEYKAMKAQD